MGLYDRDYMRAAPRGADTEYEASENRPPRRAGWVAAAAALMILLMLLLSC